MYVRPNSVMGRPRIWAEPTSMHTCGPFPWQHCTFICVGLFQRRTCTIATGIDPILFGSMRFRCFHTTKEIISCYLLFIYNFIFLLSYSFFYFYFVLLFNILLWERRRLLDRSVILPATPSNSSPSHLKFLTFTAICIS